MSTCGEVISPTGADLAALSPASPLSTGLFWRCGPVRVPVAVAATGPADAETRDDPAGDALREALAADLWAGMGSLAPDGWLLVSAEPESLVFAHREGAVGLGQVLVLARAEGSRWVPGSLSGGPRLVTSDPDERVERVVSASVRGAEDGSGCRLGLSWVGAGEDRGGRLHRWRRVRRVLVAEQEDGLHVLVVSAPIGEQPRSGWVAGVGTVEEAVITTSTPWSDLMLWDDSCVPAQHVEVGPATRRGPG